LYSTVKINGIMPIKYKISGHIIYYNIYGAILSGFAILCKQRLKRQSRMDISPKKRSKILTLIQHSDKSQCEIARLCNVSQSAVSKLRKQFTITGTLSPRRKGACGRKRKTTDRDDRFLIQQSKRDPKKTSDRLQRDLAAHGVNVCSSTVRRRLLAAGRPARKPQKKQLLTAVMKKKRLMWARQFKNWSDDDWSKVRSSVV